jgi:hypothetical protein
MNSYLLLDLLYNRTIHAIPTDLQKAGNRLGKYGRTIYILARINLSDNCYLLMMNFLKPSIYLMAVPIIGCSSIANF